MTFEGGRKIGAAELRVERLSESHLKDISELKSYEKELMDFLTEDALDHQRRKISATQLFFHRGTHQLIGYITLSNDCVKLNKISEDLTARFRGKGINYKSLPALKVCRLCVDDNFLRRGVGRIMIQFAMQTLSKMNERSGCRFLVLDAKRNDDNLKDVIRFYKTLGFEILKEKGRKETPMYLDAIPYLE